MEEAYTQQGFLIKWGIVAREPNTEVMRWCKQVFPFDFLWRLWRDYLVFVWFGDHTSGGCSFPCWNPK